MKSSQEFRSLLSVEVKESDIERVFEKEKIANMYKSVREAEIVKTYYQNVINRLMESNKNNHRIKEILGDEEMLKYNEKVIKKKLLDLAFVKMLDEGEDNLESTVMLVITEGNVLRVINELEEILEDGIHEFYKKTVDDIIFRIGLKFVD